MKQWLCTFSLFTLLSTSSDLQAWGKPRYPIETPPQTAPAAKEFPLREDQGWFVKESLLIWHPYEDDIDFGALYKGDQDLNFKLSPLSPDFKWGTGVRLAIGRYLPHHELWDVSITATYFYGSAERKSHAPDDNSFILSNWSPSQLGTAITQSSAQWRLNYFTWELGFGRSFFMTPTIVVHPHLDLRAALFYLDYENRNTNTDINPFNNNPIEHKNRYSADNDMWGVGPRFGADFSYNFKQNWSFLGNFSASLLYASFDLSTKINGFSGITPSNLTASRSYNMVAPNLEAAIGLGWEEWVKNNTIRIAASFLFEGVQWFNMNRLFQLGLGGSSFHTLSVPFTPPTHNTGDLRFFGFSVNLQVDF